MISKFKSQQIFTQVLKYGSHILFGISAVVLIYLSFVTNINISPQVRNITTIALIAMFLNYLVWHSYYQARFNAVLQQDMDSKEYCVHKRYWLARQKDGKAWDYAELQVRIRKYNDDFIKAWIKDIEEQIGLTEAQMIMLYEKRTLVVTRTIEGVGEQPDEIKWQDFSLYQRYLIKRIVGRKYPSSGIKTPRDLLYVLAVGKSTGMQISTTKAERYYKANAIKKAFMMVLGTALAGSLIFEFIDGNWWHTLLTVILNLTLLFISFFMGSLEGTRGGKIKLATAEEIAEKLEEWKNEKPTEIPFKVDPIGDAKEILEAEGFKFEEGA